MNDPMDAYRREFEYPYKKSSFFRRSWRINFPEPKHPVLHIFLFLLTVFSTWIMLGPWYSLSIMIFLTAHEMGHYLMCRKYHVRATLPYFIPLPYLNPFGTMGAFIQIKSPIPDRKALFDIGAAGPLAGFVIAVPLVYIGLKMSTIVPTTTLNNDVFYLGEPLLFKSISLLALGHIGEGYDVTLHPLAYAGWVGLFVTSLNLVPIGQLDGGHVFFSMFGKLSKKANIVFLAGFGIMSVFYPGWIFLFVLLIIFGRFHPEPMDNFSSIGVNRYLLGYIIFIIFFLSFTPIPFKF